LCGCVVVVEFKMSQVLLLEIVFGRWDERASHDRCVNKGKRVKEPISMFYIII
jgi:hypothetical protein